MSRGLIATLTYMYRFVSLGRGSLNTEELRAMAQSADTMAAKARDVIQMTGEPLTQEAEGDLKQAALVDQHIEEMVDWMLRQEII